MGEINWTDAIKIAVDLIKDSKPTGANKNIDIAVFPKGAAKVKKAKRIANPEIKKRIEENNALTDAFEYMNEAFGAPHGHNVGMWDCIVTWDFYKSAGGQTFIRNLKSYITIQKQIIGTDLNIKVSVDGKSIPGEDPWIRIRFNCDYNGILTRTTYNPTCEIKGGKGKFK